MSGGRIPLRTGTGGSPNNQVIIVPPAPVVVPPPADCPTVPGLAEWQNLTEAFTCAGLSPVDATINGGVFTATPGADTTSQYTWTIDTSAIGADEAYVCILIPTDEATFIANFRFMYAAGVAIQAGDNTILSPWFFLRQDGNAPATIAVYQPNIGSFGDPANGLIDTVTFRVLCLRINPT